MLMAVSTWVKQLPPGSRMPASRTSTGGKVHHTQCINQKTNKQTNRDKDLQRILESEHWVIVHKLNTFHCDYLSIQANLQSLHYKTQVAKPSPNTGRSSLTDYRVGMIIVQALNIFQMELLLKICMLRVSAVLFIQQDVYSYFFICIVFSIYTLMLLCIIKSTGYRHVQFPCDPV